MKALKVLLLLVFAVLSAWADPRVAILQFDVEENSIRARAAATNFSGLVQAHLSGDFQLVERAQLEKADEELKLSVSLAHRGANGLAVGKWARAEILVRGFFLHEGAARTLAVEAIHSTSAEVLAQRLLPLGVGTNQPISSLAGKADEVALRAWMRESMLLRLWKLVSG